MITPLSQLCKRKIGLEIRAQEERVEVIKEEDGADEEEDLVEVIDRLFSITVEHQGTMRRSVRIRQAHHVNIAASLTTL